MTAGNKAWNDDDIRKKPAPVSDHSGQLAGRVQVGITMVIPIHKKFFSFHDIRPGTSLSETIILVPGEDPGPPVRAVASEPWIHLPRDNGTYPEGRIPFSIDTALISPGTTKTGRIDILQGSLQEYVYLSVHVARTVTHPVHHVPVSDEPPVTAYLENGQVTLVPTGRHGGEGDIYTIREDRALCAKLFHDDRDKAALMKKIQVMISSPPTDKNPFSSLAWPRALLFADPGHTRFIGFIMPYIDRSSFFESHVLFDPVGQHDFFSTEGTWRNLLASALNLSGIVAAIHQKGHCIGDLRDANILIAKNARVAIIDCDSFQITDKENDHVFPTTVGSPEYLPPELTLGDTGMQQADRKNADLFALAIIIFRLLMDGVHPYQARGPGVRRAPSTRAKISLGLFPYDPKVNAVRPPECAPSYRRIPPTLQRLFYRCFVAGNRRPGMRPSAAEWKAALSHEFNHLVRCQSDPGHWYSPDTVECPFCDQKTIDIPIHATSVEKEVMKPEPRDETGNTGMLRVQATKARPVQSQRTQASGSRPTEKTAEVHSHPNPAMGKDRKPQPRYPGQKPFLETQNGETGHQPDRSPIQTPPVHTDRLQENQDDLRISTPSLPVREAITPRTLVDRLVQGSFAEQMDARHDLALLGPSVVPVLLDSARSGTCTYRAIRPVIRDIGPDAVPYLVTARGAPHSVHGTFISQVIRDMGLQAVRPLLHSAGSAGVEYQVCAARIIQETGHEAMNIIEAEIPGLPVRSMFFAFSLLAASGDTGVGPLVRFSRSGDWTQHAVATWALGRIGGPSVLPLILSWQNDPVRMPDAVIPVMKKTGPSSVPPIISLFRTAVPPLQTELVVIMGDLAREFPGAFIPFLGDPEYRVRNAVVKALCGAGPTVIPDLIDHISNPDLLARAGVWDILATGGSFSMPSLSQAFLSDDTRVRAASARIMVRIGGPAVEVLASMVRSDDHQVRTDALSALVTIGKPSTPALVSGILEEPGATPRACETVRALADIYREFPCDVSARFTSLAADQRLRILGIVRKSGQAGAPLLAAYLSDTDVNIRNAALTGAVDAGTEIIRLMVIQAVSCDTRLKVLSDFVQCRKSGGLYTRIINLFSDPDDLVAEGSSRLVTEIAGKYPVLPVELTSLLPALEDDAVIRLIHIFSRVETDERDIFLNQCHMSGSPAVRHEADVALRRELRERYPDRGLPRPIGAPPDTEEIPERIGSLSQENRNIQSTESWVRRPVERREFEQGRPYKRFSIMRLKDRLCRLFSGR